MKNKNIITVLSLIKNLDEASLKNPEVIADLIRAFGIVQWGPPVFGDEEKFKNPSTEMAGIYQTPMQLGKALAYLQQFPINSYIEIGVFQGGNFLFVSHYLRRFNPDIICHGADPTDYLNDEVRYIIDSNPNWMKYHRYASDALAGREFDLVFIDGEHDSGWPRRDWVNLGQHAKICMVHDIQEWSCPEVQGFWKNLDRKGKKTLEFLDCTSEQPSQGIGIIHNEKLKGRV